MTRVTIIGAGILGLACGWEIARRGVRVSVLEAARIGAGSSGGHVGALAPHTPDGWNDKKAFQLDSLLAAPGFWADIEAASGLSSGYGRTGRLQPVADEAMAARTRERIEAAGTRWPEGLGMRLTRAPAAALVPDSPTGLWIEDGLSARLNPRAALAALAAAIAAAGGEIVVGERIEGPGAVASRGPVLWATGAEGLETLTRDLGRPVGQGVKGQSALLGCPAPGAPQLFADGLHIVPHADGTVAIGSTSENAFDHDRPDALLDGIIARARQVCPALATAAVLDRWAGIRPRARSRAPLLGPWPGRPGHAVVNGGFKIGFGMAPGIARAMARLILDGSDDLIPPGFRLS